VTRRPGPDRLLPEPWPHWLFIAFFRCGGNRKLIGALREGFARVGSTGLEDLPLTCLSAVLFDEVWFSSCLSWESRLAALPLLSTEKPRAPLDVPWRREADNETLAALALRRVGSLLAAARPENENANRVSERAIR
jgi:hypothetical protein